MLQNRSGIDKFCLAIRGVFFYNCYWVPLWCHGWVLSRVWNLQGEMMLLGGWEHAASLKTWLLLSVMFCLVCEGFEGDGHRYYEGCGKLRWCLRGKRCIKQLPLVVGYIKTTRQSWILYIESTSPFFQQRSSVSRCQINWEESSSCV